MRRSVQEIADFVQAQVVGDGRTVVDDVAAVASASSRDLVFVDNEAALRVALASPAAAIIAGTFALSTKSEKPLLIVRHARLAFARVVPFLRAGRAHESPRVDSSAVIHPSVTLAARVSVEPHAVIDEGAEIGEGTRIGAGCAIGAHVRIGSHCELYPNVTVYTGARLGNRVVVHAGAVLGSDGFGYVRDVATGRYEKFPQIGRLEIEDDVEIGANATVDRGALDETRIRRGTKIDNLVHVGHNAQIGADVVIAAQTGISGSVTIEDSVVIAGQVGIADHVRIQSGAILGAQCGVPTKKVIRGKGVVFWGTPARPLRHCLKELAVLARMAKGHGTTSS